MLYAVSAIPAWSLKVRPPTGDGLRPYRPSQYLALKRLAVVRSGRQIIWPYGGKPSERKSL